MTMQWVAIAASGAAFVFTENPLSGTDSGSVSMAGSTITAAAHLVQSAPAWSLAMADTTIPVRFTFSGFETADITNGEVYHPAAFLFGDPPSFTLVTENEAAPAPSSTWTLPTGPQTEWSPNPVEVSTYSDTIFYAGTGVSGDSIAIAESYSLLVEAFVDVPDPPADLGSVYVIQNTFRAYRNATNNLSCWVRTETGKLDMSNVETLQVRIKRGNAHFTAGLTVDATSPEAGKVEFTITPANIRARLDMLGLFRVYVLADDVVIATGLLEVLG